MRKIAPHEAALTKTHTGEHTDDWRQASRCLDAPPDDFFPIGHGPAAQRQVERAKQVCGLCTVREQCLAWALGSDIPFGVFGGLDEDERKALRRHLVERPR